MQSITHMNPSKLNKYLYVQKTRTSTVRLLYAGGIAAWLLAMYAYSGEFGIDPFFTYFVIPLVIIFSIYNLSSFILNLFYRQLDLDVHFALLRSFWARGEEPSVDIFLPICGEDTAILRNTWQHVAALIYANKKIYVLDDSKEHCDEHRALAESFGFTFIERPNKGEMKKAGNMKYTFERTSGDFIVILDADFAPHPNFIIEVLPYMDDPKVGIVQTPQYFETTPEIHRSSPLAYNAARSQEVFYRVIQVARDRLGGAHCCGTCAMYRRSALASIGGFVQMGHSEDAHTGFGITSAGYVVRYLPIILSVGMCPEEPYSFFHQQHRWCLGNVVMIFDAKFWRAKLPWRVKFCYLTGFMYNMQFPFFILFSLQLFWTLFLYNDYISFAGASLFYPYIIFSILCVAFFPLSRLYPSHFVAQVFKAYVNTHAILSVLFNISVGWVATGAKHTKISPAFRQTTAIVTAYIAFYTLLILLAVRTGDLHLFQFKYWSVQFWIFWNFALTLLLFLQLRRTIRDMKKNVRSQTPDPTDAIPVPQMAMVAVEKRNSEIVLRLRHPEEKQLDFFDR